MTAATRFRGHAALPKACLAEAPPITAARRRKCESAAESQDRQASARARTECRCQSFHPDYGPCRKTREASAPPESSRDGGTPAAPSATGSGLRTLFLLQQTPADTRTPFGGRAWAGWAGWAGRAGHARPIAGFAPPAPPAYPALPAFSPDTAHRFERTRRWRNPCTPDRR